MKYFVYKTTNLKNHKEYIGVHKSNNIEIDTYLGSGRLISKAIKKYGISNFAREILYECKNYDEAFLIEKELVTREYVKLNSNYNIAPGGIGGCGLVPWTNEMRLKKSQFSSKWIKTLSKEERIRRGIKAGNTQRGRTKLTHQYLNIKGYLHSLKMKNRPDLSFNAKQRWIDNRERYMKGVKKTAEKNRGRTKENSEGRRSQALKISGENNPMRKAEVLEKFIGKTKENCEWRSKQSQTIKQTIAEFSDKKKLEISKIRSNSAKGEKNPMFGKFGELSPVAKYNDSQKLQCKQMFENGRSRKQISIDLDVNYQTVKVWLRNL